MAKIQVILTSATFTKRLTCFGQIVEFFCLPDGCGNPSNSIFI